MKFKYIGLITVFILGSVCWGDSKPHPNLNGVWRLEPSQCELHSHVPSGLTWQIEQTDDGIHLIQRLGDSKHADDLRCGTDGKDCKVKDEGHSAVMNFYYNGPILIELESEGANKDTVTKKRFSLSQDGSQLTVELIHVVPPKPAEKMVLSKQAATDTH